MRFGRWFVGFLYITTDVSFMNYFKLLSCLLIFLCAGFFSFAQSSVSVAVQDNTSGAPLAAVSVYDTRGNLLGKTDASGKVTIRIPNYPVFLEKEGYPTRLAYSQKELQPAKMQRMGGEIGEVTIYGGPPPNEELLELRDKNKPDFFTGDTTLYYHFSYSLSLPDEDWSESAEGYIALNFRGIGSPRYLFHIYRYAYFVQFDYQNSNPEQVLPPAKIMPVVLMFGNDFMSGYGYRLWHDLNQSYLDRNKREWFVQPDERRNKVFSAYSVDESSRLMEEITFNPSGKLQKIALYTPENLHAVGSIRVFSNFSKNNGINSFRTIYDYSDSDSNRLLDSISHLSTFYDKDRVYYQMKFSAGLSPHPPEQTCEVPVFYLAYNHYHPEQNGYGIWLLLEEDNYNIKRDRWLAVQDREHKRLIKEMERIQQQQADTAAAH